MARKTEWRIGRGLMLALALIGSTLSSVRSQDTLTGAFEGNVTEGLTGNPLGGARVEITNAQTNITYQQISDVRGRFYQARLAPGDYRFRVTLANYQPVEFTRELRISGPNEVIPIPVSLDPLGAATTSPPPPPNPNDVAVRAAINTVDARRNGSFTDDDVTQIPLGATTLVRTFDELTLLLPGVAPPPQTLGSVAGPGVGAGVGSAGQFSVNGLRSRANNFTVDGSDNNDEDIGVRRQGFVALIPQSIESIKEYQAITLLAPAQYGRNLGAQVNAVSRSGGAEVHGSLYGFFNSSGLNARNYFDTLDSEAPRPMLAGQNQRVLIDGRPVMFQSPGGGEDSFTFGRFGGVLGGPLRRDRTFYFVSGEGQIINATQQQSFAVPTVDERGAFGTGASGFFRNPLTGADMLATPVAGNVDQLFSLIPFPNHPEGIYGPNTLTKTLPARARSSALSAKVDENFKLGDRQQTATGRYNFTDDWREIPATGEALFSALRPEVRAQNFSFFLNSQVSAPGSGSPKSNQLRISYGRTRLRFEEVADRDGFLRPSSAYPGEKFLLNASLYFNCTAPERRGQPNLGDVNYRSRSNCNGSLPQPLETATVGGPVGQMRIAGFSPIGVDVYNFPQTRVNNTYQIADLYDWRLGDHTLSFGGDVRRSELNSDLPRLARPLLTFNGGPRATTGTSAGLPAPGVGPSVLRPLDLVSLGAPNAVFLTLLTAPAASPQGTGADIALRYYQFNLFAQDEWRARRNLSLSFGLRYEYNTPPSERNGRIERTFTDPLLEMATGVGRFVDQRERIFDPDRNNFAPRFGVAYAPRLFGRDRMTVVRGGYGLFFDQIVGAVVSQSRNVFPTFLTLNTGAFQAFRESGPLGYVNPVRTVVLDSGAIVRPGTINHLNYELRPFLDFLMGNNGASQLFPDALELTLPERRLATPAAHHYTLSIEQQFGASLSVSAAYVGTTGRQLLRFTTPNLGPGGTVVVEVIGAQAQILQTRGRLRTPQRAEAGVGAVSIFETSARSRYDSLQLQMRSRFSHVWQMQASYTLSHAIDDVSDVFDLAGAYILPQNSATFSGERASANFDIRHRFAYSLTADLTPLGEGRRVWGSVLRGLQLAAAGRLQTGQPFTVNSIFDVNLDGNTTDRLNTSRGLTVTGDGARPLRLDSGVDPLSLLAAFGRDGAVGRNTFRGGNPIELDLALSKELAARSTQALSLRIEFFNLLNRANFGAPVRLLEAPGFGRVTRTLTPGLRVQFGLRYRF